MAAQLAGAGGITAYLQATTALQAQAVEIAAVEIGGERYLLAARHAGSGVESFRIGPGQAGNVVRWVFLPAAQPEPQDRGGIRGEQGVGGFGAGLPAARVAMCARRGGAMHAAHGASPFVTSGGHTSSYNVSSARACTSASNSAAALRRPASPMRRAAPG